MLNNNDVSDYLKISPTGLEVRYCMVDHLQRNKYGTLLSIAHCRNMRGLGQVSYIDQIENLNISTEMLLNEKLLSQVEEFSE